MTDERLAELKADQQAAVANRDSLVKARQDAHSRIQQMAAEVQKLNAARKELDLPYKEATEKVADLSAQILAEEQSRAEEAEKQRQAELAAEAAAQAAKKAAEEAALPQAEL